MSEKTISHKQIILILLPLVLLSFIFLVPNSNSYLEFSFFSTCQPAQQPPPPPETKLTQQLAAPPPETKLTQQLAAPPPETKLTQQLAAPPPETKLTQQLAAPPPETKPADDQQLPAPPPESTKPDFKLLFSVLTVPEKTERRHIIRMGYALQKPTLPKNVQIDVRFVFCKLKTEEQRVFIGMEILTYGDIIVMNCTENMDEGKTYTYFSSVAKMFSSEPYNFVMKADDDAYFRLDKLYEALRYLPREDTYWGKAWPPLDQDNPAYFVGMGYALSWDLVQFISEFEFARTHTHGLEDINLAMWLGVGGRGKKRFNMRGKMYDFHGIEPKDFPNDTIGVHVLKNDFTWMVTLKNFNVTEGLQPSPFYHV